MRILLAALALLAVPAAAEELPIGQLPDDARPTAYRLNLDLDPSQERFAGQVEIDVELKAPASRLYIHGRDLAMKKAEARAGGSTIAIAWSQVDPNGVVRLDFAQPLPAGKATFAFEYDAPFAQGAAGLYHAEVGGDHYAWTQFESIDARSAYPSFDEPRFKAPFEVTIMTPKGSIAVTNGALERSEQAGDKVRHVFRRSEAIPTYLTAFAVGPFAVLEAEIPASKVRSRPLPLRILATKGNEAKMAYALAETPRLLTILEDYFGIPYPYAKLDQIASPIMGGAMENVGAIIYGDPILLLDEASPTRQKQLFGMVVAHEIAHMWFGNLVTPAWWDDLWLKESFANWLGYRAAAEWRPELNIAVGSIEEALASMNTDSLVVGRPIRQPITDSGAIDDAFDGITYGKGGQVIDMIEAYLGRETFRRGTQIFLQRHASNGTGTADDFFKALAEAAGDPRVVEAMRGFVDQQGVPLLSVARGRSGLDVTQKRYAALGTGRVPETRWSVPMCARIGEARQCMLIDQPRMSVPLRGQGAIMPNAGGHGYYRFDLADAEWARLIAAGPSLTAGEGFVAIDSLWASFRAGGAGPKRLVEAARAFAAHPDSGVAVEGGERIIGLEARGLIAETALPAYRGMLTDIYAPMLDRIGFDPRRGAHAADDPDRQKLRGDLVALLAGGARHQPTRGRLAAAAADYLGGNESALDPAFMTSALGVHAEDGGLAAVEPLFARAKTSTDSYFRSRALSAAARTGKPEVAQWLIGQLDDSALRPTDRLSLISGMMSQEPTRGAAYQTLLARFDDLAKATNLGSLNGMLGMSGTFCSATDADAAEAALRPYVERYARGALTLDRSIEGARTCGALKAARGAEIAAAFVR